MTQDNVVGKRLGFWHGTSPYVLAFIFVICPLAVIFSVRHLVGLRHVDSFWEHLDDLMIPTVLSVIGLLLGPVALFVLADHRRRYIVQSACPVCGFDSARDFGDLTQERVTPPACGHCLAYLQLNRKQLVVRELPLDTPSDGYTHYGLLKQQYVDVVSRRDDEDRQFAFVMPARCAFCGAADAPLRRDIDVAGLSDDWGIARAIFWRPYNNPLRKMDAPVAPDEYVKALDHIQTPACSKHKDKTAMERSDIASLYFTTYRYYKEFCALNKITIGPDVALEASLATRESGIPEARVVPKDDGSASV